MIVSTFSGGGRFFKEIGMIEHNLFLQSVYLVMTQANIQFPFDSYCEKVNVILVNVIKYVEVVKNLGFYLVKCARVTSGHCQEV